VPDGSAIIPNKGVQSAIKILNTEGDVNLHFDSTRVVIATETATITSRLVEGRFPKWREIRRQPGETISIGVGVLKTAVTQAAVMTSQENRGIHLTFNSDGLLTLDASGESVGDSSVEVPIAYEGSGVRICVNSLYLTSLLRILPDDMNLTIDIESKDAMLVFLHDDDGLYYGIMPLSTE